LTTRFPWDLYQYICTFALYIIYSNAEYSNFGLGWNSSLAYEPKDIAPGPNYQAPPPPPAIITHEEKVPPNGETKFKGDGFWRGW